MKNIPLILVCLFMISCSCKKTATDKTIGSIEGNWELTAIFGSEIPFEDLYPNSKPTINFNVGETKVSGKNSCNSYGGNFSLNGATLDIDDRSLFSTKMFCQGSGEKIFMEALGKVNAYSVSQDGKSLRLSNSKQDVMVFKKSG